MLTWTETPRAAARDARCPLVNGLTPGNLKVEIKWKVRWCYLYFWENCHETVSVCSICVGLTFIFGENCHETISVCSIVDSTWLLLGSGDRY